MNESVFSSWGLNPILREANPVSGLLMSLLPWFQVRQVPDGIILEDVDFDEESLDETDSEEDSD